MHKQAEEMLAWEKRQEGYRKESESLFYKTIALGIGMGIVLTILFGLLLGYINTQEYSKQVCKVTTGGELCQ